MRHVLVFREGSSVDDEDDARSCNDESVYVVWLPASSQNTYICKFISQYDSIISSVLSRSLLKPQVKKAPHTAKAAKQRSSEVRGRRGRPQPSLNASTIFIFFLSLALFRPFLFYSIAHGHWIENMICGDFFSADLII